MHKFKFIILIITAAAMCTAAYSQDSTVTRKKLQRFSSGGIFLNAGAGIKVPLGDFFSKNSPSFGILGRLEMTTTGIFPLVPGAEITYFSFNGTDDFKTKNLLTTYKTKILSFGITFEYALAKLFRITYAIPFITADVKYNKIKREIAPETEIPGSPLNETKFSGGIGAGITLFLVDIYVKFNYMKGLNHIGAFVKFRIPVVRF